MPERMRPNRVQKAVCRRVVADVLGDEAAEALLRETGVDRLPDLLPAGPRDLETLGAELQPFVDLYRAVAARAGREDALAVARRAILESGRIAHAGAVARAGDLPLTLTSPPPPDFAATPDELERGFEAAMRFFSCEGRLLAYSHSEVRFHITACNWVRAMERAGAPELIAFFCETDERFMDGHPTHRLERPTAIGLGHSYCDFLFAPRKTDDPQHRG